MHGLSLRSWRPWRESILISHAEDAKAAKVGSPSAAAGRRHCVFADSEGRRFLSDGLWIAEPDRCTEPPFALGTLALESWTFPESGLGGR